MLARESDEAAERDKKIDQLLNAIEVLKNNLVTRATPEWRIPYVQTSVTVFE